MERLVRVIIVFSSIISAMPMSSCTDQSPKAVEKWSNIMNHAHERVTKLHFFCHHLHGVTAVTIGQAPLSDTSPTHFGLLDTRDDPMTVGSVRSSKLVGYAQGISAAASLEEITSFDPFTFVFTDEKYNGSTLAVLGSCSISSEQCETPVVGGTGVFRLARGIVTTRAYYINFTEAKAIMEINVVVLHY